jgi:hypothetical protein
VTPQERAKVAPFTTGPLGCPETFSFNFKGPFPVIKNSKKNMRYIKNICFKNIPRRMISELMANFKIAISHRGERGHAGHVPDGTSSITDEGDETKKN